MPNPISDLDCVVLTKPHRGWDGHSGERDFAVGEIGTVVMVFDDGAAYDVEFVDGNGRTTGLTPILRDALRLATAEELRVAA